jgi:hypothetical protein
MTCGPADGAERHGPSRSDPGDDEVTDRPEDNGGAVMHGKPLRKTRMRSTLRRADAITWIDPHRAIVARTTGEGDIRLREFALPEDAAGHLRGLADVARAVGDADRVIVTGPESSRATLEREFVSIFRAPERLEDFEPEGPMTRADLVALLRERQGA